MAPWNKGLTKGDPRVASGESKRREKRVYASPYSESGRLARAKRSRERIKERDPLGLLAREERSRRQARRLGLNAEVVDYRQILDRDHWICGICGDGVIADDLSFDHRIALRDGGEHVFENIQVAHAGCNSRKGEMESREPRLAALKRGRRT